MKFSNYINEKSEGDINLPNAEKTFKDMYKNLQKFLASQEKMFEIGIKNNTQRVGHEMTDDDLFAFEDYLVDKFMDKLVKSERNPKENLRKIFLGKWI